LTALFGATVYYFGSAPVGFLEALKAAIEAGGNLGIDGLLGIFSPQVVDTSTANPDGSQTTPTEPGEVNQASVANTTASDGNNTNVAGAQGPEDPSIGGGDDRSVGAAIGITAAGLGLVLLVLLVAGRRRRRSNTDKIEGGLVHRQFTDDEEEDGDFSGTYAREIDAGSHAKNLAQVVGEDDDSVVIRWGEGKVVGGQDIYSQPVESIWSADERKVMESHSCSSPSCKVCEMKTQEGVGIQFFASPKSSTTPVPLSRESRSYMSNDTVDL
jgi:MYXO-CTERM domain-containing protein